ncbi:MAG TPA: zinc-ribbon domain-containing protein [Polyangiaceae bacterium]|nr:zinc-ribbon domain-containing protein [Polyangiaceae bacterium]
MDVRCNRCGTEYEFDDALISERGTTVKCTHCGHQFKVFGSRSEKGLPERWTVRTSDGREIVYSDLRELQSDILERKLSALDRLSRGNQAARQLGAIAELAPFFRGERSRKGRDSVEPPPPSEPDASTSPRAATPSAEPAPPLPEQEQTPHSGARSEQKPAPASSRATGDAAAAAPTLPTSDDSTPAEKPAAPDVESERSALTGAAAEAAENSGAESSRKPQGPQSPERTRDPSAANSPAALGAVSPVKSSPFTAHTPPASSPFSSSSASSSPFSSPISSTAHRSSPSNPRHHSYEELSAPPPSVGRRNLRSADEITGGPPSVGRRQLRSGNDLSAAPPPVSRRKSYEELSASPPSVNRRNLRSYDELSGTPPSVSRRSLRSYENLMGLASVGRHARSRWIAALVIAALAALFMLTVGRRYLPESVTAGRVGDGLRSHRVAELLREGQRLLEDGDFEGASEPLLRASALSEKDPAVLAALARVATQRADVIWLKLRLLDPKLTEVVQATRKELGRRVGKARTAVDAAFVAAPEDIVVIRARVDALRLSGEATEAREWIRPIAANASDPQNAYVLAALDLADASPSWASAIDRLRTAANGERTPGRAQAALIFALARSGRIADAEAELGRLDSGTTGGLLIDELRAFVKRSASPAGVPTETQSGKLNTAPPAGSGSPKAVQARGEQP